MSLRVFLIAIPVILAVLISYDLGSQKSRLLGWVEQGMKTEPEPRLKDLSVKVPVDDKYRKEAKVVWERALALDPVKNKELYVKFMHEKEPDKQYQILLSMGVNLSRQSFDRISGVRLKHEILFTQGKFYKDLMQAWCLESPREAVAWGYAMRDASFIMNQFGLLDQYLYHSASAFLKDTKLWSAFLLECPDPALSVRSKMWVQELQEPGSIWSFAETESIPGSILEDYVLGVVQEKPLDTILKVLVRCTDDKIKEYACIKAIEKLSSNELQRLVKSVAGDHTYLQNLYAAVGGDSRASYFESAEYLLSLPQEVSAVGLSAVYAQWFKKGDAYPALMQLLDDGNQPPFDIFMQQGVKMAVVDEAFIVRSLKSSDGIIRDKALVSFYSAFAAKDPRKTLELIIQSDAIEDQVVAAKEVLFSWAQNEPMEAMNWFKALPKTEDHSAIETMMIQQLLHRDFDKAISFIQESKMGLSSILPQLVMALHTQGFGSPSMDKALNLFNNDPAYDKLVFLTGFTQLGVNGHAALRFMEKHSPGHWQNPTIEHLTMWLENENFQVLRIAPLLKDYDFSSVSSEKMKRFNDSLLKMQQTKDSSSELDE